MGKQHWTKLLYILSAAFYEHLFCILHQCLGKTSYLTEKEGKMKTNTEDLIWFHPNIIQTLNKISSLYLWMPLHK